MKPTAPAIELSDLTLGFGAEPLCSGLTLSIPGGANVMVSGRSGSGKSTLLKALLGFVRPHQGRIRIQGQILNRDTVWTLRREMAYLAQEPDLGTGSVRDCLLRPFGYRMNRVRTPSDEQIRSWFERFFLSRDLQAQDVSTLSGGQKQRVALIIAVLLDRPILLLDEPTSALDQFSRIAVTEYIDQAHDKTVLWVSHDPTVMPRADRVVPLDRVGGKEET